MAFLLSIAWLLNLASTPAGWLVGWLVRGVRCVLEVLQQLDLPKFSGGFLRSCCVKLTVEATSSPPLFFEILTVAAIHVWGGCLLTRRAYALSVSPPMTCMIRSCARSRWLDSDWAANGRELRRNPFLVHHQRTVAQHSVLSNFGRGRPLWGVLASQQDEAALYVSYAL